jgi:hypothetical protein
MKARITAAAVAALLVAAPAGAQWAKTPDRAIPRTTSGEADLMAPAPRMPDGKPDLSGVWMPDAEPLPPGVQAVEGDQPFPRHMINIAADLEPEDVPLQPWAAELLRQRLDSAGTTSPMAYCKPTGVPWINAIPLPYKIVQTRRLILILYEEGTVFRQIFLDGRKPVEDAVPRWMGYSTGQWDGDQLVVETVGLTDQSWLDGMGHPHSDRLRIIERFRRHDAGHLSIATTIDDPGAYTRPMTYTITTTAVPDEDLLEYFCTENEKSSPNYN